MFNVQAPGQGLLQDKYHVNVETASSGLSLYVLGFAAGPLVCELASSPIPTSRAFVNATRTPGGGSICTSATTQS